MLANKGEKRSERQFFENINKMFTNNHNKTTAPSRTLFSEGLKSELHPELFGATKTGRSVHVRNRKQNAKKAKFMRLLGGGLRNARAAGEGLGGG